MKKFKFKYKHLLFCAILLINIGLLFGFKIQGRLAVSNIFQIIAFVLLIPIILKYFKLKQYLILTSFVVLVGCSAFFTYLSYGVLFKISHFIFFLLSLILLLCIHCITNTKEEILSLILKAYKVTLIPTFIYMVTRAIYDILILGNPFSGFGFDDKSHAVFLLSFYSFISLRLLKSNMKYIISIGFLILSLLTISRLVVIFAVLYLIILIPNIVRNIKASKSYMSLYFKIIFISLVVIVGTMFINNNKDIFKIFERVNSIETIQNTDSTSAHLMLIKLGLLLKFDNISNIIFGVTPGGFSSALYNSDINLLEFAATDPGAYKVMVKGDAPMHSTHTSIFAEFPLPFFIAYLFLLWGIFKSLFKNKLWLELFFYLGFLGSAMFYSTHNELVFYSILIFYITITSRTQNYSSK